jgi:hypothetical protein
VSEKKNIGWISDDCFFSREQISEMLCELYSPSIAMPEAPKQGFLAKLFSANSEIDSDQLCKMNLIL